MEKYGDITATLWVYAQVEPGRRQMLGSTSCLGGQACSRAGAWSGNLLHCMNPEAAQGGGVVIEDRHRPPGWRRGHPARFLSSLHRWRAQTERQRWGHDRLVAARSSAWKI